MYVRRLTRRDRAANAAYTLALLADVGTRSQRVSWAVLNCLVELALTHKRQALGTPWLSC